MKKRVTAIALALAMVLGTAAMAAGGSRSIQVSDMDLKINGQSVIPTDTNGNPVSLFSCEGTTYAPLRYLAELLGYEVEWNKNDPRVALLNGDISNPDAVTCPDGTYTATTQGFAGDVTVWVTVKENRITAVTAQGLNETPGRGSIAIDELPTKMVASNNAEVEAVSGATITSNAMTEAVKKALVDRVEGTVPVQSMDVNYKAGTYSGKAFGHNDYTTVEVTFSDSAITDIVITKDTSDVTMKNATQKEVPARIVAAQSLNIDVVSGATQSSSAIINAVTDCVKQASDEATANYLRSLPKAAVQPEDLTFTADVAVVGGGGSGLMTATYLAQQGYRVVVLEAADVCGGMTNLCGGGSIAIGSQLQKDAGLYESEEEIEQLKEAHYETLLAASDYLAKPSFLRAYVNAIGDFGDWVNASGITCRVTGKTNIRLNDKGGRFDAVVKDLTTNYNVEILTGTRGTDVITDNIGNITGVKGTNSTGGTTAVTAKAVVLATGGFLANTEMVKEHIPQYTEYFQNWSGSNYYQGDGVKMAWAVGAAVGEFGVQPHDDMIPEGARNYGVATHGPAVYGTAAFYPSLWVNRNGRRFVNEDIANNGGAEPHGGVTMREGIYYTILDQAQVTKLENEGSPVVGWMSLKDQPLTGLSEQIEKMVGAGYAYKADTIEELAKAIGADPAVLGTTVDRYNKIVDAGEDPDFKKDPNYLNCSVKQGPYYALTNVTRVLAAYGGLDIDENMSVLDNGGEPIPGLYAVGLDAGSFMGNVYSVSGTTCGFAICSGYMAGQSITAYLKG